MLADAAMIQLALIAALLARLAFYVAFEGTSEPGEGEVFFWTCVSAYSRNAWPLTGVCLIIFLLNGFYTYGRYYRGRYKALIVTQAVCQSYLLFGFFTHFLSFGQNIPRGALILAWLLSLVLLVGARIWSNMWEKVVHPEREAFARRSRGRGRRVLVIGGAGYIGSALMPKLLDNGYHVRLLDILMYGEEPIKELMDRPNLEIVHGDFRHVENVVESMRDMDSVIHLGGIVGDPACSLDEDLTVDINLSATRMIAELAKAAEVDRFIFASTCSVYGACDEMLDEHSWVKPISLYGNTKLASENLLHKMASRRFAPTSVRFGTIYGLSGRTRFDLVVNLLSAKAKIDGEITVFGGDQWRPFLHVDDAARAVAMILDAPKELVANEIFNVGSNEQNMRIAQIGELVHQQVISAKLRVIENDDDKRNYRVDFSKIRNRLGFTPQWTIEQGIQQVLEAIASGEVTDYRDVQYSNVKFLTQEGTSQLARDRWAHELIRSLASQ